MNPDELKCPCMPMCPNYGKCRQCIAAHAAYYTVPKCIKLMQEKMKREHLHPSNPHLKKTLPQRVADYYEKNPHAKLRTAAEALNITQWQLLDAMEGSMSVPVADFGEIYDHLQTLDHVMLHLDTGSVVLQLTTPLPLRKQHGDTVILSRDGLTALLFPENLYAIFLVREKLADQRESLSIALVGEEERIALSIYLCRGENHQIEETSKALFETLWNKYQTNKGETT